MPDPQGQPQAAPVASTPEADGDEADRRPRYGTAFVSDDAGTAQTVAPTSAGMAPTRPSVAATAAMPPIAVQPQPQPRPQAQSQAASGLPRVQSFQLPVDQLAQIATGSGLQWVNSDAEKIAAVQAAIAAEPKPIRVPRERPPVVANTEGPLVLVETRRDLRELKLPFEQQPPASPLQ
ncbi:MAG: hypothetical protein NVS2B4_19480 [Ramlibacter sp.]